MAKPWADVAASAAFQSLSAAEQEEARKQYFEEVVAPRVPQDLLSEVRSQFDSDTKIVRRDTPLARPASGATAPSASEDFAQIDYGQAATDMMGGQPSAPSGGLIQRVGDALRPAPRSVLESFSPTPEQTQAELDRRLSYGAGPISLQAAAAADAVRSSRGRPDRVVSKDPTVNRVVEGMDRQGTTSLGDLTDIARRDQEMAAARAKAEQQAVDEFAANNPIAGWIKDNYGAGTLKGVATGVKAFTDVFGAGNVASDYVSSIIEDIKARQTTEKKEASRRAGKIMESAEDEGVIGQLAAAAKAFAADPAEMTFTSIGIMGPMLLGGKALAGVKGVQALGATGARLLGTAGGAGAATTAGSVLTGGVMGAGFAKGQIYDAVYELARKEGYSVEDAKKIAIKSQSYTENPDVIALVAVATAAGAGTGVEPMILNMFGKQAAADLVKRGVIKSVTSSLGKELPLEAVQGGSEKFASNVAAARAGFDVQPMQGVWTNAGLEAMAAGTMAAPAGALQSSGKLRDETRQEASARMLADALRDGGVQFEGGTGKVAIEALDPQSYDRTLVSPLQTVRQASDVGPAPRVVNFTEPGSATDQAGLTPIVVPVPSGEIDVSTTGLVGSTIAGGSQPASDFTVPGLGDAGLGGVDAAGATGVSATGLAPVGGEAAPLGAAGGQQPAGLARPFERATDADLLARTEASIAGQEGVSGVGQPQPWAGRSKNGYATEQDADQARATASAVLDTKDTHDWRVEPMNNGRFQLVPYPIDGALRGDLPDAADAKQSREPLQPAATQAEELAAINALENEQSKLLMRNGDRPDGKSSAGVQYDSLGNQIANRRARLLNLQLSGPPASNEPIVGANGKPFSTEKTAAVFAQQNGITGYSTVRMGDGWAIQPQEANLGSQTPQAVQATAQGQEAAAEPATEAGATAGAAAQAIGEAGVPQKLRAVSVAGLISPPLNLDEPTRSSLRLAPQASMSTVASINSSLNRYSDGSSLPADQQIQFNVVSTKDLTDQHRIASAVARLIGKTYTVVREDTGKTLANGYARLGGQDILVAEDSNDAPLFVAIHEGYHGLPRQRRQELNKALLQLFRGDMKGEFLTEFDYTDDQFEEEAPAFMAQVISKRADFWEQLRTKMGNKEFGEVAKVIINKLSQIITGASKEYGSEFADKYITDIVKARDLLSTAYAQAMQEQGLRPDAELSTDIAASQRSVGAMEMTGDLFKPQTDAERRSGFAIRLNNPVTLADGSRLSGFTDPVQQATFYGYDKNGERFTIRRDAVRADDIVSSKDSNRTANAVRASLGGVMASNKAGSRAKKAGSFTYTLDDKGRITVSGDANRIKFITNKIASGTVLDDDEGVRFKAADTAAVAKALKNAPKANPEILASIQRQLGLTDAEVASTSLEYQTGEAKSRAFDSPLMSGIPEVVKFLEDRRRASGLRLLDIANPEDQDTLAKLIAVETLAGIRSSGSALEWYDETIAKTLAMASVKYPELGTDKNAQMAFRLAMAITSQGLNVENNLKFTMRQYENFRTDGKFPEVGEGESGEAMVSNFKLINELLDPQVMGPDMLRRFLVTEFTIGELNRAGFEPNGELVDEKVLGSSVLGPKIGFGFYSNLNGNFEPVTMDMWFMRTIGRLTGNLRSFDAEKFAGQVKRFRDGFDERGDNGIFADRFDADLVERARTEQDAAIELARQVKKAHERDFRDNRAEFDAGDRKKSQLVFAADTMIQSIDKPKDVPGNGMERRLLREVVRKAVAEVEKAYGQRIPPAAMQALIWYPEQELYKSMGVKLSVTSQDYAGATEKVLTEEGYDAKRLRAAAKSGSARVRQANGRGAGQGAQGNGQEARRTGPLEGTERERFIRSRYEQAQLQLERVTPKRRGVIFEVAPDPNNAELTARWNSLTPEQRLTASGRVVRMIVPRVLAELETDGIITSQVGSYLDDTNPSFTLLLDKGDPVEFAKVLGFVLSQDSMMVISPKPLKSGEEVGAIVVEVGDKTDAEIKQIYDSLREIEVKGERPIGGQSYANGAMTILNYSDVPTGQLAILVDQKLNKGYTVLTRSVFAAFPQKKDYDYASETNDGRGSRALLRQRARGLRAEASAALEQELDGLRVQRSSRLAGPAEPARGPGARTDAGDDGRGDGRGGQGVGSQAAGADATPKQAASQEALTPLPGAPRVQGFTGPDPRLVSVAEQYARDNGISLRRQAEYVQVDEARANRIATAYALMKHDPQNSRVKEAYQNLIRQTRAQYDALVSAGYKFWFIDLSRPENVDYVSTPWNAMRDIRANQEMGVFPTADGFGTSESFDPDQNPLLEDTGLRWPVGSSDGRQTAPVLANDLFRAVHDAFGHGLEGSGFRAQGEENAWQAHVRLFTGSAVGAITSETRGQNSWLNYGPHGEKNRTAKVEDTVFADQKTGLMPEWTWTEGRAGDMPEVMRSARVGSAVRGDRVPPDAGDRSSVTGIHYGKAAGLARLTGASFGSGIKGAEQDRLNEPGVDPRIKKRVYFYLTNNNADMPRPEIGLGNHVYRAVLGNMYDPTAASSEAVARVRGAMKGSGANAFESAVLDAGYRGYVNREQGTAVVLNSDVPVAYEGLAQAGQMRDRVIERVRQGPVTRTEGDELVRKPTNDEMVGIIKARPALAMAAPSFKLEYGEARVSKAEAVTADEVLAEAGAAFRFGGVMASKRAQTEAPGFKAWSKGSPVVSLGQPHEYISGQPVVVEAIHGTTGDFDAFDRGRANIKSDLGGGFYATNNVADVGENYAGLGPDLTNKIERRAEELFDQLDEQERIRIVEEATGKPWSELTYEEKRIPLKELARREIDSVNQGFTMPVFVRFDNPVVLGGRGETFLEYREPYNEETEEYGEPEGDLVSFVEALRDVASEYTDADADTAMAAVWERVSDDDGIKVSELIEKLKTSEGLQYATDDSGNSASTEIIRRAFEAAGFDGFIDTTVNKKFGSEKRVGKPMAGMDEDTVHFIAFRPDQMASRIGSTWDRGDVGDKILRSTRVTDTPAFKKWFGDSKVVDEQGRPMVVYHGTPNQFTEFALQDNSPRPGSNFGFYFTPDKGLAEKYYGKTMAVYLSIKNPKIVSLDEIQAMQGKRGGDRDRLWAMEAGHDGARTADGKVWIAFQPTQIKSAIGNQGTFDPENPDIRRSTRARPATAANKELAQIFTDLQEARGLKLIRAKERAAEHPMASQIEYVNANFYDILEQLDDAGLVKINCKK